VDLKTKRILKTNFCNGKKHDLKLYKESRISLSIKTKLLGDSGYQGILKVHTNSQTPIKKPAKKRKTKDNPKPQPTSLTKEQKATNKALSSQRITVEHVNREIKIFKITSERYRNRRKRFGLRVNLISGIYNFELGL
jgi:DDE superfamily endonuclease